MYVCVVTKEEKEKEKEMHDEEGKLFGLCALLYKYLAYVPNSM